MEKVIEKLTDKVRRLLREFGRSQQYLAQQIGINQSNLNRRLQGRVEFSRSEVAKIADGFGMELEALLMGTDREGLLQTYEVVQNEAEQLRAEISEERADNERFSIENKSLQEANQQLTAELRERPKKEDVDELRQILANKESQIGDLTKRAVNEEKAHDETRKAKQATEKSWEEVCKREMQLLADLHNVRETLRAVERTVGRLEGEKNGLTTELASSYEKIENFRKVLIRAQQDIDKAKQEGRSSNTLGILLGAGAGALLASAAGSSSKPKKKKKY